MQAFILMSTFDLSCVHDPVHGGKWRVKLQFLRPTKLPWPGQCQGSPVYSAGVCCMLAADAQGKASSYLKRLVKLIGHIGPGLPVSKEL